MGMKEEQLRQGNLSQMSKPEVQTWQWPVAAEAPSAPSVPLALS